MWLQVSPLLTGCIKVLGDFAGYVVLNTCKLYGLRVKLVFLMDGPGYGGSGGRSVDQGDGSG